MTVLNLKNFVYMSTLTDIPTYMLKLDVHPGKYKFQKYAEGYVFVKDTVDLNTAKLVKIFATRDGTNGLGGTYWDGESKDPDHLRIYNNHICDHLDETKKDICGYADESADSNHFRQYNDHICDHLDKENDDEEVSDYYEDEEDDYDEFYNDRPWKGKKCKKLPQYHNLPVMFYLNKKVTSLKNLDLNMLNMEPESKLVIWQVLDDNEDIGLAIKSPWIMLSGDQAGIAVYDEAVGFGNFNMFSILSEEEADAVHQPCQPYHCKFNPCTCQLTNAIL